MTRCATKWRVWYGIESYITYAVSEKQAITFVRHRESLRYVPMWRFTAEEVT